MQTLSTLNQLEHQIESQYMKCPVTVAFLYYLKGDSQECLAVNTGAFQKHSVTKPVSTGFALLWIDD